MRNSKLETILKFQMWRSRKKLIDAASDTVTENNLSKVRQAVNLLPEVSGNKDRTDNDAIVLVKKLGLKAIASGSLVTYDPVWKSENTLTFKPDASKNSHGRGDYEKTIQIQKI